MPNSGSENWEYRLGGQPYRFLLIWSLSSIPYIKKEVHHRILGHQEVVHFFLIYGTHVSQRMRDELSVAGLTTTRVIRARDQD